MESRRLLLEIAGSLMRQPTAPFREQAVCSEILAWLGRCQNVTVEKDGFGNVIAKYQRGVSPARFAYAAHMDHPAYVDDSKGSRRFLGGVPEAYRAKNPPVREFGGFAMWDLPEFEVREDRIYSRACDDLIGCAAILAMFIELERMEAEGTVYGLFTRAEEVGFVGAVELAKSGQLPPGIVVVSLETSSEKGGTCKMGDGVIVRVGDRASIFDPEWTANFMVWAKESRVAHQRALMSGGTCEATAYKLYGYKTAALCVALGNYHNCGEQEQIAPEYVSITDVEAMVALCVAGVQSELPQDPMAALRERLERERPGWEAFI